VTIANSSGTPRRSSRSRTKPPAPRRWIECHEPRPAIRNSAGIAHTTPSPAIQVTASVVWAFLT
jgi:hypothetical protein